MGKIISIAIGYVLGLIQSAFFVGKTMKGIDIRDFGSGNIGSTNALRVLGKKAGLVTIICDIFKAVAAFVICRIIFKDILFGVYACAGVVLGHDFPFYLKFKGGKGIASMIGMLLCLGFYDPVSVLLAAIFGIGTLSITGYVSAGSLAFSSTLPFIVYFRGFSSEIFLIILALGILAVYKHKANISRLLNGTERRISFKKSKE
ncbi:MAG: glycerol-3-phosphate 1-O-acyltransferase PlsY [Lachnospiraceae bacterium]|nr:glycerol-3-phosphate 1-O-acyltransferase PlsY [Lachnospiraceae bacterium]